MLSQTACEALKPKKVSAKDFPPDPRERVKRIRSPEPPEIDPKKKYPPSKIPKHRKIYKRVVNFDFKEWMQFNGQGRFKTNLDIQEVWNKLVEQMIDHKDVSYVPHMKGNEPDGNKIGRAHV